MLDGLIYNKKGLIISLILIQPITNIENILKIPFLKKRGNGKHDNQE